MKKILVLLFIATLLVGCASQINKTAKLTLSPTFATTQTPVPTITTPPPQITPLVYIVKVTDVIDGDTIDVQFLDVSYKRKTSERVRMLGVDTPEVVASKNKPYEYDNITDLKCLAYWGKKAKEYVKEKLEDKKVEIEFDSIAPHGDHYGRLIAYVFYIEDGKLIDFTAELVKEGYARVYIEGALKGSRSTWNIKKGL